MTLDIAPTPVTFLPRRGSRRSAYALAGGAVLAIALALLWTGVDRIAAFPRWIGAEEMLASVGLAGADPADTLSADSNGEGLPLAADDEQDAPATTGAVALTANETPPPEDTSAGPPAIQAAAVAAPEEPTAEAIETAEPDPVVSDATPSPAMPPAAGLARLAVETAEPTPPAGEVAVTEPAPEPGVVPASEVMPASAPQPKLPVQLTEETGSPSALPDEALDGAEQPATLAGLADEAAATRLPRARPTPSPETIAAVTRPTAPQRDPYYVVPEPAPTAPAVPPSYAERGLHYVPFAPQGYEAVSQNRLTILGRVNKPVVIYRRGRNGRIFRYPPQPDGTPTVPWSNAPQPYSPPYNGPWR